MTTALIHTYRRKWRPGRLGRSLIIVMLFAAQPSARASAQVCAYVTNRQAGTVSVIDTTSNTVSATITVGQAPIGVALSPGGTTAYVTNSQSSSVSIIDTATNSVTRTLSLEHAPVGVVASGDGAFVYTSNSSSGTVSVIDTNTMSVTSIAVGGGPEGIAVTPDSALVYVANRSDKTVSVIETATGTVRPPPVGTPPDPADVAITPNGSFAYVSSSPVTVIDIGGQRVTGISGLEPTSKPRGLAITPDGAFVYLCLEDSSSGGKIWIISTATNTPVSPILLGDNAVPSDIAFTPDGALAYVVNQSGNEVSAINTATKEAVTSVAVGSEPSSIAIGSVPGGCVGGPRCVGDCDNDGLVTVNELVTGVNNALGVSGVEFCEAMDADGNDRITVNELVTAVNNALGGCPQK